MKIAGLVASLVVAILVLGPPSDATVSRLGPPTICFPYQVADESKCLAKDRDEVILSNTPIAVLVGGAIDRTDDVLTRMESLRRAFLWTENEAQRDAITSALEHRVVLAELSEAAPEARRARAIAWFTLGYWRQAVAEGSRERFASEASYFEKALRIDDTDGAMLFGAAIANLRDQRAFFSRIAAAHAANERAGGKTSLLATNLMGVLTHLAPDLVENGYEEIGARAARKVASLPPQ